MSRKHKFHNTNGSQNASIQAHEPNANYTFDSPSLQYNPVFGSAVTPPDIIFNSVDASGNKTELGRIVTDKFDQEINIDSKYIPIDISSHKPVRINLNGDSKGGTNVFDNLGIQAVSLDISGEAAFKVGAQMEVSLIGLVGGANKGDFGVALQGNGLLGLEGSVTGSASAYWSLSSKRDLTLGSLEGAEYGFQGSVFGPSGSYFEGINFTKSFPFVNRVYGGASLGVSIGIPELGGSFSGYLGASKYIYRSDKK